MAERPLRRRWARGILTLALGAVALAVLARAAYPFPFRALIEAEAARHGLDPLLLAAVVHVESRFDPFAVSPRGARGLMQLMPETGLWAAGQAGLGPLDADDLFIPEVNVRLGAWYLADLQRRFGSDLVLVLAAYNAGRGRVAEWAEHGQVGRPGEPAVRRAAAIPYPETRAFVLRVLRTYAIYRWLYAPLGRVAP